MRTIRLSIPMMLLVFATAISAAVPVAAYASEPSDSAVVAEKPQHRNIIQKITDYFNETNKVHSRKDFDFSIIGGPHYSSDSKFGVGVVAAGSYYTDSIAPQSVMSVTADATTAAHFKLSLEGLHAFPHNRYHMNYKVSFSSIDTKMWGIGYDMCSVDSNESRYKYLQAHASVDFLRRFGRYFYIGPVAEFNYINGRDFDKPWLINGEADRTFNTGIGIRVSYDSRDCVTAPCFGVHLQATQLFNPKFMANKYAYSMTEVVAAWYGPLWRDCTLAAQFHARFTYGNTPWGMLSTLGGSENMRGYFEGRYRDKSEMDVCVELRQHIWRRNGIVAWVGAASIFPKFSAIRLNKILPNYGIGYRWEFKKRVNVRLDLGFGRGQTGFIFSINEAF